MLWLLLALLLAAHTPTPDIHIQGILKSGHLNNITCTASWDCDRGTPIFSWMGANRTPLGPLTPNYSVFTFTSGPQHHGTNLTCRVALEGAEIKEKTVKFNVTYTPWKLTICVFQGNSTDTTETWTWASLLCDLQPPVPEVLGNTTSLHVQEGQSLHLVCETDGNDPGMPSSSRRSLTLSPFKPSDPGILELPQVMVADAGEFTCQAQHLQIYHVSLNLAVQGVSCTSHQVCGEQQGSWPLVLTLIRGALMGAGFLLTYCLTWLYYTRFRGSLEEEAA
ncbi:sialic acid-binding Ig-like lectin 14 [Artibeus jamaicensis]|uniref:sialic acid-binding Ig-like lectin 14 n=1 Tax=Artibeus jamaicensis TaxID=9417 RepID=UPI00235ACEAB|nr:sialic acid-binding Ig-like lectin 14 [Artibeus jamaicensis]